MSTTNWRKPRCTRGHLRAGENLYLAPNGKRYCLACRREDDNRRYGRDSKKRIEANTRRRLFRQYGMTPEAVADLRVAQGGRCAICERATDDLHLDHNHTTKQIRELLCHNCNVTLGLVDESVETLGRAIAYLQRHDNLTRRVEQHG